MAIVDMKKLRLAAMSYERDNILNALQKTGAAEIKLSAEEEDTACFEVDSREARSLLSSAEAALSLLVSATEDYKSSRGIKEEGVKDGFEVSYSDFMAAKERAKDMGELTQKINALTDKKNTLCADISKIKRTISTAWIYSAVQEPLASFCDTEKTRVWFGVAPSVNKDNFSAKLCGVELSAVQILAEGNDCALLCVCAHRSAADDVAALLSEAAFSACPFSTDKTGKALYEGFISEEERMQNELSENEELMYALSPQIKDLKIYCDYLAFELEKKEVSGKMRATERTFLLEAYVPEPRTEDVKAAIDAASTAVFYEFCDPDEDEIPPTLMENKPLVRNFETITNMYSPPSPKEFDPNAIMGFFYSVFMGFIMGDMGYGLLMLLGGGAIYLKTKRDCGLKRLSGVFAVGGIFAIIWGVLFNSFFGFSILHFNIMPVAFDMTTNEMTNWTFIGISIPAMLIVALLVGIVQLGAGYACKAVQYWRRGKIFDGICEGITWVIFSLGVFLAILGLVEELGLSQLAYVGGIMAAVGLVSAMLTAGRKEKFIGKFTKGFGAAYGVINYASDVLSYARLYGLMLSGVVIAQIVSMYGSEFIISGNVGMAILGIVIILVGHGFNLAISLLGAYIHDARLQYVEFYGKFFEGEGELFAPLGSKHKYVYVIDNK